MANIKLYASFIPNRFRNRLIVENNVVAVWMLGELTRNARNIVYHELDATFSATGVTRGVPVDILTEGGLGATFNGSGYAQVTHDGTGYLRPGDSAARSLSCNQGDLDVAFLIKTTTNDATLRCIMGKQETNSSGNGWHVALQNGAIRFYLKVGGVQVFDMSGGAVADGEWHLVQCSHRAGEPQTDILIDNVSAATSTAYTTEPLTNTGNFRIGMFNNETTASVSGFIGTLAYPMVSREGNSSLSNDLMEVLNAGWTDISADVRIGIAPMVLDTGVRGQRPDQNTGSTGTLDFALNNAANNSGGLRGYYTIGHANCRAGWDIGTPIKLEDDNWVKFHGWLKMVTPAPGEGRSEHVSCTAVDWLDVAAISPVTGMDVQVEKTSGAVAGRLIDETDQPPVAVDIDTDGDTFPYAFDNSDGLNSVILQELTRVVNSESGMLVVRGSADRAGIVRFMSRPGREQEGTVALTLDQDMTDLVTVIGSEALINIVRVTVHPREVDGAATTILYTLERRQRIPAGEEVVLSGSYRDPANEAESVGATDLVALVAGTDYVMYDAESGGSVITSSATVKATLGASSFEITVFNSGGVDGYFDLVQIRGRGLYTYTPVTVVLRDEDSVRKYGPHELVVDMPFQDDVDVGRSFATKVLDIFSTPRGIARSVVVMPEQGSALWDDVWQLEPGDRVAIGENMTALDTGDLSVAVSVQTTIGPKADDITVAFDVFPTYSTWVLGVAGLSELGETTVLGE